jgi:hypothetical protein
MFPKLQFRGTHLYFYFYHLSRNVLPRVTIGFVSLQQGPWLVWYLMRDCSILLLIYWIIYLAEVAAHSSQCSDPHVSAKTENGNLPRHAKSSTFNSIHGLLLQLCSLVDNIFGGRSDSNKEDQILGHLIEVLSKSYWLGCRKLCRCPIVSTPRSKH